jgi:hypothetical protein
VIAAAVRVALSAAAAAFALWLIPASVHIASWGAGGPIRIAYLAPIGRLVVLLVACGAAAGLLVAYARRRHAALQDLAARLSPLLLLWLWTVPYLPWLPDRSPLLLVFAGPLRWAIAAGAVLGVAARAADGWRPRVPFMPRPAVVFFVSFAIYAALGVRYARDAGFGGDEPHYLVITQSLIADRDLDIANNHERRDYRSYFPGELRPDFLQRGLRGEIYSIHAPGLPALLVPAFAIGGAIGAIIFMAAIGGLAAVAVFEAAAAMTTAGAAAATWIAACFSIPFVPHAWLIYPEIAGALVAAWSVKWLLAPPPSAARALLQGAALAVLPWLHTKFALLLAFFAAFELLRLWPRLKRMAIFAAPIAISGAAWLYSFRAMYGVFDPEAPYGNYTRMFVLAKNIPRGTLGLLFDQKFGLLAFSPVYILAVAGAWMMIRGRSTRWLAIGLLAAAGAFFVSTTRLYMWWGGSSAPARFLVPIVPLLAPMLAVAIERARGLFPRAIVVLTFAITLAVAVVTLVSPAEELLYSNPHGVSALATYLQGSAPFDALLPTFTEENWRAPLRELAPWMAAAGLACAAVLLLTRLGQLRSLYWTTAALAAGFVGIGSVLTPAPQAAQRRAIVAREQLGLMRDYDPTRTRTADLTHMTRLRERDLFAAATLTLRHAADDETANPRVLAGPFELPEGRYEARVWFDSAHGLAGDAIVGVSDQITLAHGAAAGNPSVLPFALPIRTPAFVGVSDPAAARAVRRIDLAPVSLVPRSQREPLASHVVEPTGGSPASFMAYADDHTYPEGGVFWTRDTEEGSVLVATAGARTLRLVLHVGPPGGTVMLDAAGKRLDVDLEPQETREIDFEIPPGTAVFRVSVRAARSFRPSEVDPTSSDNRRLGCQVRPMLMP